MFYKKKEKPQSDEIVLCTVKKVSYNSVFAVLDEYKDHIEGMIHISEIAPGRIRNIRDYVKPGKKIVCKVLKINPNTGNIDLSLRRATLTQRITKQNEVKQELKAEKLLTVIGKPLNLKLADMYTKVGFKAVEEYGGLFPFFEEILIKGKKVIEDLKVPKDITDKLFTTITEKMKPPEVLVKGRLELTSYKSEGIEDIKKLLLSVEKAGVKVNYLGAPNYQLEVKAGDYKTAEDIIKKALKPIEKQANTLEVEMSYTKDE